MGDTLQLAGRDPGAGMGMLVGPGAMFAEGEPIGAPAGEVVGVGVVPVGAVIQDEAETDAVELVGSVDGGTPGAFAALLGVPIVPLSKVFFLLAYPVGVGVGVLFRLSNA